MKTNIPLDKVVPEDRQPQQGGGVKVKTGLKAGMERGTVKWFNDAK